MKFENLKEGDVVDFVDPDYPSYWEKYRVTSITKGLVWMLTIDAADKQFIGAEKLLVNEIDIEKYYKLSTDYLVQKDVEEWLK